MRPYWRIILITTCLIAGLGAGVSPSQADGGWKIISGPTVAE